MERRQYSSEQENNSRKHVDTLKRELKTLLTTAIHARYMGEKTSVKEELVGSWINDNKFLMDAMTQNQYPSFN